MKTRKLVSVMVIAGAAWILASCDNTATRVEDVLSDVNIEKSASEAAAPGDSCDFSGTLSDAEIEGLLEMREEEKLARDVYQKLYEIHKMPVFNNISKSENAHTSAVLHLLNGFGIEDPAKEAVGEFTNETFTKLYNELIEKGSESLVEGLKTGAFIEEYDIADLNHLLDETENETIMRVYGNLLRGSKIHLRAFTNLLELKGETYQPTIISAEEYNEIISVDGQEDEGSDDGDQEEGDKTFGVCDGEGPNG